MRLLRNLSFSLVLMIASVATAQTELHVVPVVPMSKPIAGHYAGIVNNELWTWGGFNYTTMQYRGVVRKYYPQAYGASVCVPQGAVCIGGATDEYVFAQAIWQKHIDHRDHRNFCNQYDHSGRVSLTALPVALKYLAAAYDGAYVYAVGGENDSCVSRDVYRMEWPEGKTWEKLPPMPEKARSQSVAVVQNDVTGPCLYVFGGYEKDMVEGVPTLARNVLKLNLRTMEWESLPVPEDAVVPAVGATGAAVGFCSIAFIGGKSLDNRYEDRVMLYNTYTNTWSVMEGEPSFARANATLSPHKDYFYLAGGEVKPDTYTDDISVVQFLRTSHLKVGDLIPFFLLLIVLLVCAWRDRGKDTYLHGDGKTPWWAIGMSLCVTVLSPISLMLIPTAAFASSWSSLWFFLPLLVVVPMAGMYMRRVWNGTAKLSVYDKLGVCRPVAMRWLASTSWLLFNLLRSALLLCLPSFALASIIGLSPLAVIVAVGLLSTLLSVMGGTRGTVLIQTVLCLVVFAGVIVGLATLTFGCEGGLDRFLNIGISAGKFSLTDTTWLYRPFSPWMLLLCGLLYATMLVGGDQSVMRHYGLNADRKAASRGFLFGGALCVSLVLLLLLAGTGLYTCFASDASAFDITLQRPEWVGTYYMLSRFPSMAVLTLFSACAAPLACAIHSAGLACASDFSTKTATCTQVRVSSLFFAVLVIALSQLLITLLQA